MFSKEKGYRNHVWFDLIWYPLVLPELQCCRATRGVTNVSISWRVVGNLTQMMLICQVSATPGNITQVFFSFKSCCTITFQHWKLNFWCLDKTFYYSTIGPCSRWTATVLVMSAKRRWNTCIQARSTQLLWDVLQTENFGGIGQSPSCLKHASTKPEIKCYYRMFVRWDFWVERKRKNWA